MQVQGTGSSTLTDASDHSIESEVRHMADKILPTQEELRRLFDYDPETGELRWASKTDPRANRITIGALAGRVSDGYRRVCVRQRLYMVHVLIWVWMTGEWPTVDVDHRDLVRSNNRWNNLRLATRAENMANTGARKGSQSGVKGIGFQKGKWTARLKEGGRVHWLGRHSTIEAAKAAYDQKAVEIYGEFARTT